jgi:hypothetical protein
MNESPPPPPAVSKSVSHIEICGKTYVYEMNDNNVILFLNCQMFMTLFRSFNKVIKLSWKTLHISKNDHKGIKNRFDTFSIHLCVADICHYLIREVWENKFLNAIKFFFPFGTAELI